MEELSVPAEIRWGFFTGAGDQDSKKPSQEAGQRLTQTALLNSGLLLGLVAGRGREWGGEESAAAAGRESV